MTQERPITPPPELIAKWAGSMCGHYEAARWGADQELKACAEIVRECDGYNAALDLLAARRPKPPSLKEQALDRCNDYIDPDGIIRRALESLPD